MSPNDHVSKIFEDGLDHIEFGMALYSLEATTRREIADSFYQGTIEKDMNKTIAQFLEDYLGKRTVEDRLFITKIFQKFYKSVRWEVKGEREPGSN